MIDHDGAEPVYLQVAQILRDRIKDGTYRPNKPLPNFDRLAQELGVARGTISKVVGILVEEGLLRTVVGRGTYVQSRNADQA